jgi:hypothetical protein
MFASTNDLCSRLIPAGIMQARRRRAVKHPNPKLQGHRSKSGIFSRQYIDLFDIFVREEDDPG